MEKIIKNHFVFAMGMLFFIVFNCYRQNISWSSEMVTYGCELIKLVLGIGSFAIVLTNEAHKETNKAYILAYGYSLSVLLIVIKIYLVSKESVASKLAIYYYKCHWSISILSAVWTYIMIHFINEKTQMKKWKRFVLIIFCISNIFVFYTNHYERALSIQFLTRMHLVVYSLLCSYYLVELILYLITMKKDESKLRTYPILVITILSSQVVYTALLSSNIYQNNELMQNLISCIGTVQYIGIFIFIYQYFMEFIWVSTGKDLKNSQIQLEEERFEKHMLVYAAYVLKQYVNKMDEMTNEITQRLQSTQYKYIEKIKNNCHRLTKLSDNIVALGQMDIGELEPEFKVTNMTKLVEVLVESIIPYTESRKIRVEVNRGKTPIFCYVDSDAIERVLLNLISNAIKYNDEGGLIKVSLGSTQEQVYLSVQDTGVGIPKERIETIFERFERVENGLARRQEGSGLGLAIVKSIVEIHQGKITIQSEENKGTLVRITLPLVVDPKKKYSDSFTKQNKQLKHRIQVEFSDLN